jgi:hypothetical protein
MSGLEAMSSYISSSRAHAAAPRGLVVGGLLALCLAVVGELVLRARGVRPSVPNTAACWRAELDRAEAAPGVVLVGSSRFQAGVLPGVLAEELGRPVYNLTMEDSNPLEFLEYVAERPALGASVVLVEGIPARLFGPDEHGMAKTADVMRRVRQVSWSDGVEVWLQRYVYGQLTLLHPSLRLREVVGSLKTYRRLPYAHVAMTADRALGIDFTMLDADYFKRLEVKAAQLIPSHTYLGEEALGARMARYRAAVATIHERGGSVVFVRPVATGAMWAFERAVYPTKEWWGRYVDGLGACALSFEQVEAMQELACPDGSHLDMRDRERATRMMGQALVARCSVVFGDATRR